MSETGSCGLHRDIPNPVTQSVLLEELFGEVLEVPLGEGDVRGHSDLGVTYHHSHLMSTMKYSIQCVGLTIAVDLDVVTELARLAIDLDTVVQELLEGRAVKDTVVGRTGVVDDELVLSSGSFGGSGLGLEHHTERKRENPGLAY